MIYRDGNAQSSESRGPLRIASIGARGIPSAYSGVERACESLYTRLVERGHHVTLYCRPEYVPKGNPLYRGVELASTPNIAVRSLDALSSALTAACHASISRNFDLIHFHAIPSGIFACIPRLRGIPIVSTIHGLDWQRATWKGLGSKVIKQGEYSLVRHSRRMIVVSRDLKRYYQTQYGRITSYISNGVEAVTKEMLTDHSVLQKFNLQPKQYVLFLARLVPEKRVHDLLQAYAQVNTGKKLVIAGEGGYTSRYVAELRHMASTDNRVIFTGFQSGLAVHSLFHNASAYVLPSEMEGLPLALLEAISHGIVPVVSDIPPHRELLGSIAGYNLFFAPGDVCGLAESLRKAISRPEHYQELSTRIRAFVQNNYSWDAITTLTEELYYDAVANGPELAFDLSSGTVIQTVMEACGTAVRGEAMRS